MRSEPPLLERTAWPVEETALLIRMLVVLVAVILGGAAGWLCGQIPVRPFIQNTVAGILGWIIGSLSVIPVIIYVVPYWMRSTGRAGVADFYLGASIISAGLAIVIPLLAAAVWSSVNGFRAYMPAWVVNHSAIVIASTCGLCSALWAAQGAAVTIG